ncbi:MAG: hypothetical protein RXO24_10615, partial [Acidilobus sp.]
YTYATKQHSDMGMELKGMAYEAGGPGSRLTDYINGLASKLGADVESGALDLEQARGWLRAVREATARLQSLADRLESYVRQTKAQETGAAALAAPNETVAKAQPIEAPQVTTQAQTTQPQLTPEDIDREVKELLGTLKGEFRRAQDGSLGASSPTPYAQKRA